jgi:hypothetical protein
MVFFCRQESQFSWLLQSYSPYLIIDLHSMLFRLLKSGKCHQSVLTNMSCFMYLKGLGEKEKKGRYVPEILLIFQNINPFHKISIPTIPGRLTWIFKC